MKLIDLFEEQKIIEGDVDLPIKTTKLDYRGVIVKGYFSCAGSRIKSLEGAPKQVGGDFNCSFTEIKSLKSAPGHVGGSFSCASTEIDSLEGAPNYVGGDFDFYDTKITSLHNVHKYIKHIGGELHLNSKIRSHMLGIMFIKGLKKIAYPISAPNQNLVESIFNKHLPGGNPHDVQEALIEAGLPEYAKI